MPSSERRSPSRPAFRISRRSSSRTARASFRAATAAATPSSSRRRLARRSCSKSCVKRRGQIAVGDGHVHLVVQLQRSVVEVRRAEHAPASRPPPASSCASSSAGIRRSRCPSDSSRRTPGADAYFTGIASVMSPSTRMRIFTPRLTASSSAHAVDSSVTKYGVVMSSVCGAPAMQQQVEPLQVVAAAGRRAARRAMRRRPPRRRAARVVELGRDRRRRPR